MVPINLSSLNFSSSIAISSRDPKTDIIILRTSISLNFQILYLYNWMIGDRKRRIVSRRESERRKRNRNDNKFVSQSRPKAFALLHSTHSTYCETYLEPLRTWVPCTHTSPRGWGLASPVLYFSFTRLLPFLAVLVFHEWKTRCAHEYRILNHRYG